MDMFSEEMALIRKEFPRLSQDSFVYLDTAATAQKPSCVIEAMDRFYRTQYGTVHRAVYEAAAVSTALYQEARAKVARFLGARSCDEIIFTRGATSAINLACHSFGRAFVGQGDEILITEMEHHSNIVPWQMMAQERGAKLCVVPFLDNGELDFEAFCQMLTPRTKIFACTHISNVLGTVNPIEKLIKICHENGVRVLVDGAQSVAHMPIDVRMLDCDFFVFSGHKLYGPTGVGVLYGKKELLEVMPPVEGGGDMIERVTFEKTTYNRPPLKFEAGTPMITEVIGLGAAIDFVERVGLAKICAYEEELLEYALEKIRQINGIRILGEAKKRSSVVSFVCDGMHPLDLATLLDLRGIAIRSGHLCAQPCLRHFGLETVARISIGVYTTKHDIDRFIDALKDIIKI